MTRLYLLFLATAAVFGSVFLFDLASELKATSQQHRTMAVRAAETRVHAETEQPVLRDETLKRVEEILNPTTEESGGPPELTPEQQEAERIRLARMASKAVRHDAPLHPQMITPGNFQYLGAFRPPADPGEDVENSFYFGGWAVTYRPDGDPNSQDEFPGSLFVLGHEHRQLVAEISIPAPVVSRDITVLPVAQMLQPFGDITAGFRETMTNGSSEIFKVGGMEVVDERLHWTVFKYYNVTGVDYPSHGASSLETNALSFDGPWHLGPIRTGDPQWHSYKNAGYITKIPQPEADAWFQGRDLLSGLQISTGLQYSSQGPALYAYRIPQEAGAAPGDLNALPLLWYTMERPLARHHPSDRWTGAAWLKLGDRQTVVIIGRKSLGELYYGEGRPWDCNPYKGYHGTPYEVEILFYSPSDLVAVASGQKPATDVQPWYRWNGESPGGGPTEYMFSNCEKEIGGMTYDADRQLLYIVQIDAGSECGSDWGALPVIHVFRIVE
ncbi:MAG: hypothetical protein KDA81_12965 [Planctomycetaceae bacterium]|nr:hypothetical protein [Planctomycetaceae bacterium]